MGIAPVTGPYTVKNAIEDYLAARERRGSKGVRADRYAAEARVIPKLGAIEISKLTAKHNQPAHWELVEPERLPTYSPVVPKHQNPRPAEIFQELDYDPIGPLNTS